MPENQAPVDLEPYRRYIEGALAHSGGTHTFDDIRDGVASGTLQFWPGIDSVIITQIVTHPQTKVLHFFLAGGNLSTLEKMFFFVMAWGKMQGCETATLIGRKGWGRSALVTREGWEQKQVVLETNL